MNQFFLIHLCNRFQHFPFFWVFAKCVKKYIKNLFDLYRHNPIWGNVGMVTFLNLCTMKHYHICIFYDATWKFRPWTIRRSLYLIVFDNFQGRKLNFKKTLKNRNFPITHDYVYANKIVAFTLLFFAFVSFNHKITCFHFLFTLLGSRDELANPSPTAAYILRIMGRFLEMGEGKEK